MNLSLSSKLFEGYPCFFKAIKIPAKMEIPPRIFQTVSPSPKIKKAKIVDPIGSPKIATATMDAGRYFRAQLKVV